MRARQRGAGDGPARATLRRGASPDPPHPLVALVTRLVIAQTGLAAAIGLLYSRRHLTSIVITLMLVAALCGLVLVVRSGTPSGWLLAVGAEAAFVLFGLLRPPGRARQRLGEAGLAEAAEGAIGGRAGG